MRRIVVPCFVIAVLFLITLVVGGESIAKSKRGLNNLLRGDYAFTLTKPCSQGNLASVPDGGNLFEPPPELRLRGGAASNVRVTQGTLHYNGDGTGRVRVQELLVLFLTLAQAGSSPVRQNGYSCDLIYDVNPDRSFTQQWVECEGERLAGMAAEEGEKLMLEGSVHRGQIALGRQVLVFGDTDVNVEEATSFIPNTEVPIFQAICGQSGTAVKIRKKRDEDDDKDKDDDDDDDDDDD